MTAKVNCARCDGKGYIKGYSHVKDGVCFKCGGSGKVAATKRNIEAARAIEPQKPSLDKMIATELHIRAGFGRYVGYSEESVLEAIDRRNKEQFRADFAAYLAANVEDFMKYAGLK